MHYETDNGSVLRSTHPFMACFCDPFHTNRLFYDCGHRYHYYIIINIIVIIIIQVQI